MRLSDILPGGPGKRFHVRDRKRWDKIRKEVICRDMCYDLGIPGLDIPGAVIVHHIIPVDDDMYAEDSPLNSAMKEAFDKWLAPALEQAKNALKNYVQ